MQRAIWIGMAIGLCLSVNSAIADEAAAPPKEIAKCEACHGPRGDSVQGNVPRLNGQHAEYIAARLRSFLDPGREDPHATEAMWGVVRDVNDTALQAIGLYYSKQTPTGRSTGAELAEEGRKLYMAGDPAGYIPACASCHGADGAGHGAIPRLAGQHADYLTNQLERLRLDIRASGTMHPNTNSMTDRQIKALVAYLANG